jgi:tripartite-type tricarboxylate transporter receptor subunit TctC
MNADTIKVLAEPATRVRLDKLGVVIVGSTPDEFGALLKEEMAKWGPVIKAANIKVSD